MTLHNVAQEVTQTRRQTEATAMDEKQKEKLLNQIRERFSNNVRILRKRKGWSQEEFSQRLGVHRVSVARIETAVHHPSFAEACIMADLLGVSIFEMRTEMREE
jgi:ribosome-binding protein aMBF1 (putative translation factor)